MCHNVIDIVCKINVKYIVNNTDRKVRILKILMHTVSITIQYYSNQYYRVGSSWLKRMAIYLKRLLNFR